MMRTAEIVAGSGERLVVVVDDDSRVRESIGNLLSSASLPSRTFENASSAFEFLAGAAVGCVVTDIAMAGMNGWEFQKLIATSYPGLPVIVVSGSLDQGNLDSKALCGSFALIDKPIVGEELLIAVRAALGQHFNSATRPP